MDYREELERLDTEIFYLREAIENLECVSECEDVIEIMRDRLRELTKEKDGIHATIEIMDDYELDRLREEYLLEAM